MCMASRFLTADIYVVGAASVGKTTLVNQLQAAYQVEIIPEVARSVLNSASQNVSTGAQVLKLSYDEMLSFQLEIVKLQYRAETSTKRNFISDRSALDCLVYGRFYCRKNYPNLLEQFNKDLFKSSQFASLMDAYRSSEKCFVLIKPDEKCIKADGVRLVHSLNEAFEVTQMFQSALEEFHFRYGQIDLLDSRVEQTVQLLKGIV